MRKTETIRLVLAVGVVLGVLALISNASAPSVAGVALLQFGCSADLSYPGWGPTTVAIDSFGQCSPGYSGTVPGPTPVPAGQLYHLRVLPSGLGTKDGSVPKVQFVVYDNGAPTSLTCTLTAVPYVCDDFAHQYVVKSGDQISINAIVPDSNTFFDGGTVTVEESVFR